MNAEDTAPVTPPVMCEHHFCRCMRCEEISQMADAGLCSHLEALEAHYRKVRCRLVDVADVVEVLK